MSPRPEGKGSRNHLHPAESPKETLALGLGTGGFVVGILRNLLVNGLLHGFLRPGCLIVETSLLLFGAGRRIRDNPIPCKHMTTRKVYTENSLLCARNVWVHGSPDLGILLVARINDVANATDVSMPFHSWLGGIGVVLHGCTKGQFCIDDGFLPGSGYTATLGNKLVLGSGMIDL